MYGLQPMTDLAIIIVSWNVKEKLRQCLRSIDASSFAPPYDIWVVDNASHDGSGEMVAQEFPRAHLIPNTSNFGTSKALNQALAQTDAHYALWLNPDMRLFPDTLRNLMIFAQAHPRAGIIGARLEREDGNIVPHIRRFPALFDQLCIILKIAKLFPRLLNYYLCADFDYSQESAVDSVRGSFFCIRRELIKSIGLFDERFFVWFEEVDYCRRARDAGFEVWYAPKVRAVDYVGRSFAQVSVIKKQKMYVTSMVKYFVKHGFW